jgi:hypothetical protein
MRVETRQPSASDVQASIDSALTAGEVRRTATEVRVGAPAVRDADGLRTAAAWAARALRADGGTIAWRAEDADEVRAIVEGTAYGAYDPGLFKGGYTGRPELTLAVDAPLELHGLVARGPSSGTSTRRAMPTGPRTAADACAPAAHAKSHGTSALTVESHDAIDRGRRWERSRPSRPGAPRTRR